MKIAAWMVASTIVIPTTMISLGILLGPRGYEGLLIAPIAVFASWALILAIGLRRRVTPKSLRKAKLDKLALRVTSFLHDQRSRVPADAAVRIERLIAQVEELAPMLSSLREDSTLANRLRKLLASDLTELLDGYHALPAHLRTKELHGGPSPAGQLAASLDTIFVELQRLQEEIAADALYSLSTKQRYLELKYGAPKDDGSLKS